MEEQADGLYELMGKKKPVEEKNSNIAESNLFRNVSDADYSMLDDADKATANMKYWNDKANLKQNIAKLEKCLTPEQQKQYQILNSYLSYVGNNKDALSSLAKQMTGKDYGDIYHEDILSMFLNNPDMYSFEDDLAQANDNMADAIEKELTDADGTYKPAEFYAMDSMLAKKAPDEAKNRIAKQIEVDAAKRSGDPGDAINPQEYAAFDVAANDKMDWGTKGTVLAALRDASRY